MGNIVNIVLGTTILILLILLVRWLFWKRCNPNILYFLWIFVALRILIPINIPVDLHNMHLNKEILRNVPIYSYVTRENTEAVPKENEVSDFNIPPDVTEDEDKPVADIGQDTMEQASRMKTPLQAKTIFILIWCCGSILLALYFVLVNFYTFHNIKKRKIGTLNHKIEVYEVAGYNCLVGVFKPQIFIAPQILENPLYKRFVLLHEVEHYKTRDNFWLLIGTICLIVQWFNPLVWIAYFKVQEDCELACDYRVISCLDQSEKESYVETLLHILETNQKRVSFASPVVKGKGVMKKRMKCIFEKRKTKLFFILLCFVGIVTVTTFMKVKNNGEEADNTKVEVSVSDDKTVAGDEEPLVGSDSKYNDKYNTSSVVGEKNAEVSAIKDVSGKNSWYQKTKLVTKDMELQELKEEELEKLAWLQQELFKGLSDEEITEIKEKLAGVHGGLEGDIVYYDYGTLTDPDSERWEVFNDTTPDDNVDNGHWGPKVIQDLEEVKRKLSDDKVKKLITDAQDEIQAIMDERSNEHVMKAHMILHDLDYWLFRYPVADFENAPADWSGIYIYYGELDGLLDEKM